MARFDPPSRHESTGPINNAQVLAVGGVCDRDSGDRFLAHLRDASHLLAADRQNFGKMLLVFGCIGTDFCKKICALQHFSKSRRLSS